MIATGSGDYVSFGGMLIFSVGLPAVGLLISIVSMQKQGINRKCGFSTLLLFVALLIECFTWTLSSSGGIIEKVEIGIMFGTAGIHCLSAIIAIMGLAEMRSRRKWSRGGGGFQNGDQQAHGRSERGGGGGRGGGEGRVWAALLLG